MYTEVRLLTRKGEFIRKANVLTMTPLPEMVSWGSRFFVRTGEKPDYYEGLLFPVS